MKKTSHRIAVAALAFGLAVPALSAADWTKGMKEGNPGLKSISQLTFGPDGILFVADSKAAAVVAIATGDTKATGDAKALKVEGINKAVAGLLGTSADQVLIDDLAVNPISHTAYLAISRGRGPDALPVLVKVKADGTPEVVSLEKVKFSKGELPDAPSDKEPAPGARQGNPRKETITDIAFFEDRVLIAGLANEEFASNLRAIPFPFATVANGTSVEIYHGAHGKFETRSPVRTLVPFKVGSQASILAAYTCTPLVQIPVSELKPGAKVMGKTIAELGNRNRPIDMITYQKGGKDFLLLANSSRGVMKITTEGIDKTESITSRVEDKKGLGYETLANWTGVEQLDRLDNGHALVVRRGDGGSLNLESFDLP